MPLLQEIQNLALDENGSVASLLRRCLLLGSRLNSVEIEAWVRYELNGYPREAGVPSYRVWSLVVMGDFIGPFGSQLRNQLIMPSQLPERARDAYRRHECRDSVAAVESVLSSRQGHNIQLTTGDLARLLHDNVFEDMRCLRCWAAFDRREYQSLLSAVRTRVLDLACQIEKVDAAGGETLGSMSPEQSNRITQIFHTTVIGGTPIIGSNIVAKGDLHQLTEALSKQGVSDADIQELKQAVEQDPPPKADGTWGPRVSQWMGKMTEKAASGAWKIGTATAVKFLADALGKYGGF